MRIRLTIYIAAFLIYYSNTSVAQNTQNSLEISPYYGLQMFSANNATMKGNFFGGEVVYHLNMLNNKADWARMLHVKDISFAASFRDFDGVYLVHTPNTNGFLGQSYGLTSRLNISLFNAGKTEMFFTPGFGFAYATQTYYTNDNPLVGSHINFTAQVGLKLATPISSSTRLLAGVDLYHYSNAAVKLPNDGVNSLNASVGIDHDLDSKGPATSKSIFGSEGKSSFEFAVNFGKRGLVQQGGGIEKSPDNVAIQKASTSKLYNAGFYAGYSYRLNPLIGLKIGTDAVYYTTTLDTIQETNAPYHHFYATYEELASSYDKWRVGISAGTDIWLGRVVFDINYGQYVHFHSYEGSHGFNPNPPGWYWTFGGKYFFNPWFAVEAKQYLHKSEADYVGLGVLFRVH
jgi:hypothetical protein